MSVLVICVWRPILPEPKGGARQIVAKLKLKNICKSFKGQQVIRDLSLDIADRQFVVLVGPSGCGKTTLLRIIAGLEEPTAGQVVVNDKDYTQLPPQQRNVAMVFQSYALFPHMTVYDNIAYGLRIRNLPKEEIRIRVADAAQTLNLEEQLNSRPAQLSGGQRQRVAMGRALVRQPDLFLFDEPLSNLDAMLRMRMRSEIKSLHQKLQNTIVYVTHDQIEAMTLADQVVVLHQGVIAQEGTPIALYDRPANMFVAGFIGSPAMNFMRGKCEVDKKGNLLFRRADLVIALPQARMAPEDRRGEVVLGVRPEHLELGEQTDGLRARVNLVEQTGSQTVLHCQLVGNVGVTALFHQRADIKEGHNIYLRARHTHLFCARDAARINTGS